MESKAYKEKEAFAAHRDSKGYKAKEAHKVPEAKLAP